MFNPARDNAPSSLTRPLPQHPENRRKGPPENGPDQRQRKSAPLQPPQTDVLSLYTDEDEPETDDGAILILCAKVHLSDSFLFDQCVVSNDPKSARKPIRLPNLPAHNVNRSKSHLECGTPQKERLPDSGSSSSESESDVTSTPGLGTPSRARASTNKQKAPRKTKAALAKAEQKRRETYAQKFFLDLNRDVFGNGLPIQTELIWNKRLLTTAGRAKWHR